MGLKLVEGLEPVRDKENQDQEELNDRVQRMGDTEREDQIQAPT